jgi:hypothetical protein
MSAHRRAPTRRPFTLDVAGVLAWRGNGCTTIALARLSLRRPVLALLAWTALAVALGAIGFGIEHRLSPSILVAPGSESARAEHLARAQFGSTQLTPILLLGPRATLDRDGPALVRDLRARPRTRVLSAWDTGSASAELAPSQSARMIVVSIDRSETAVLRNDLPQIERLVDRRIQAPAHAHITGQASIDASLKSAMIDQTRRVELFAIPLLFLVLLLLLRAPIAAMVVTAFGATTVFAGMGAMTLLARVLETDPTAVAVGSLAGLALGVGFALMMVQRFREERARGTEPRWGQVGDAVQHRRRLRRPADHEPLAAAVARSLPDPDRAGPGRGNGRRARRARGRDQGPQEAPQEPERLQEAAEGRQARPRTADHRARPGRRRRHAAAHRPRRGLGQLTSGAGQLATGLSAGTGPTGQLVSGLGVIEAKVHKFSGTLPSPKDLEQLQRDAPGLFDSGYFVLAAVEGAPAVQREQATFTINLLRGGTAGQIVVVPKQPPSDPATRALGDRLHDMADAFAARTHTQVAVGGPEGNLADFTSVTSERLPLVVVALALATALLLMLALRSVLAPLVATAVLLDALVVRPVVLPAAVELLGRRAWWPTRPPVPAATDPGAEPPSRPAAPPRVEPIPATP